MSKAITLRPRKHGDNLSLVVSDVRTLHAWLVEGEQEHILQLSHDGSATGLVNLGTASHLVLKTTDGLTLSISMNVPSYFTNPNAINVQFSHCNEFGVQESMPGGRFVLWHAQPFVERSEFVLDVSMSPGQAVRVKGNGFDQEVCVQ